MLSVDVLDAARELEQFLAQRQWQFALIGGLALNCRGEAHLQQLRDQARSPST